MLYMFRTILVHHQEQLYKLYIAFGIFGYVWLLCGYRKDFLIATLQSDVSEYTKYEYKTYKMLFLMMD